ncbi:hypothetical protein ACFSUS_05795 [Spirosoma soli]|uniref:DUF4349 domain-containing protein n=1 Tax=Spirosoma soli TaxID=1770529 RepID=A0ABW5M0R9_9BACT
MKNAFSFFVALLCLFLSSCHRPTAYFQRTPHAAASRLPTNSFATPANEIRQDSLVNTTPVDSAIRASADVALVSVRTQPSAALQTKARIERRVHRMQSLLKRNAESVEKQPRPKPKPKNQLRLGNRIRQGLGIPLREELNWWQRISWKLKASVIIILVAVLFAILHVTLLAIIFGIIGAFLLISGLKKSFKVRRPWF